MTSVEVKEYINQFIRPAQKRDLLDFFAGQAPNEIPAWFDPEPLHDSKPKVPTTTYDFAKKHDPSDKDGLHKTISDWYRDPCFDFDKGTIERKFQDLMEDYYTDLAIWQNNNQMARYFQWRWYYAKMMLDEREKRIGGQREEEKEKIQES